MGPLWFGSSEYIGNPGSADRSAWLSETVSAMQINAGYEK